MSDLSEYWVYESSALSLKGNYDSVEIFHYDMIGGDKEKWIKSHDAFRLTDSPDYVELVGRIILECESKYMCFYVPPDCGADPWVKSADALY